MKKKFTAYLFFILIIFWAFLPAAAGEKLKLATTTSFENTGLINVLLPPFEKKFNIKIDAIIAGTGKALMLAKNGDVDVVLVHNKGAEDKFIQQGFGINRRSVMYNNFVIIGPPNDPAGVKGNDVVTAFSKIANKNFLFVSRGDESGTHIKEKEIWGLAKIKPEGRWYLEVGQGMGQTLWIAYNKGAYCLVDKGTYITYKNKIDLVILCEGDIRLFNPYSVIAVSPYIHPHANYVYAMAFIGWLTSPEAQKIIGSFKKNGELLFHPNAGPLKQ